MFGPSESNLTLATVGEGVGEFRLQADDLIVISDGESQFVLLLVEFRTASVAGDVLRRRLDEPGVVLNGKRPAVGVDKIWSQTHQDLVQKLRMSLLHVGAERNLHGDCCPIPNSELAGECHRRILNGR